MILPDEAIASKYCIKTHYVMRVIKFYPETQTVDLVQDQFEFTNTPFGDIVVENEFGQKVTAGLLRPTVLYGIPVKQLRWGQFEIQACPQPGDTGYIEVFTNDISSWLKNGQMAVPKSDKHFLKESSVFVPFMPNSQNCSQNYVSDEKTFVIKSKNAVIKITDNGTNSDVSIEAKTVTMKAPNGVDITGDVNVTGNITSTGDVSANGISLTNHQHNYVNPAAASTTQPGVTTTPIP